MAITTDGTFEGYASLFHAPDLGRDVVMPGAFRASLARRGAGGVRMLWQHDPGEPIGLWLAMAEDERGLRVTGRLNLAVRRGRELLALMQEGALDGLSIGFKAERTRPDRPTGGRRLLSVDLWEVSLVTFPLLPGARVTAVKAAPDPFAAALRSTARRLTETRAAPPSGRRATPFRFPTARTA